MTERPRILLVEDVADDAELALLELRRAGLHADHRVVDKEKSFVDALREFAPDLILSDFSMPGFDGMAALALAREVCPDTPFIFVSGTIGEESAVRALRSGATDYVMKTNLARLPAAVERALREGRERAARRKAEEELETLRERLRSIVSTLPDVVWSVAVPSREILYVSPASSTVFGRTQNEVYENRTLWGEPIHPEDRPRIMALWQGAVTGETFEAEYRIVKPGGEVRWIQGRGRFNGDAAGNVVRIDGISRDITERRERERKLTQLSRVHAVLSGINSAIVRVHSRDELFRDACRIAVGAGQFRMAWAGVVDCEAMRVRPVAWDGEVRGFLENAPLVVTETGGPSLVGQAVRGKRPVISNDIQNDPQRIMKAECLERGINSLAVLPLIVGGEAAGVLSLYAGELGFFDSEEMTLLVDLAGNISFALEHIESEEKVRYLAYYDSLTGLANRTLFLERLGQHLSATGSGRQQLALVIVNIERFKTINDTFGLQAGDALLKQVAGRLLELSGDPSRVARVGADHFAVVVPHTEHEDRLIRGLEQSRRRVNEDPYVVDGTEFRITTRAGVALFPSDGEDADTLFRNAEAALKKSSSGDRYLFYTKQMTERIAEKLSLENKLRQALEKDEFVLYYQPKVDVDTRRMVSAEALIRWRSPELGLVPPLHFIPLLEETGLILQVGSWALRRASLDHRDWAEHGLKAPRIAVNVSPIQLRQPDFVDILKQAISEGVAPPGIDLEITESLAMEDIQANIGKLTSVRGLGVNIAIDDFGTGYSSLGYLAKLPVQSLKIDRSFIIAMVDDPDTMTLVSTIVSLAHSLRLKVVAEGVDSEDQAEALRRLRCDEMQGYLFSKPLPRDELTALLEPDG
ncbi:MAG TPA: EAL domain-containing protein [Burkholderiales bacterium]|nr:EAL domain-containing protein [Burkholderiales bacterium]